MKRFLAYHILFAFVAISTVYANYYQSLLDLYNDRKTLEGLYVEIGQNLSKRVATEVERSNLSFIAIYGGVAKWNPNELGNKLSTLTENSPDSINEASLAPDAKEYRTEHYVNLVVLCVASHLSRGKPTFANPAEIMNAIQDKTRGLKRFMHPDVFNRLMSLNVDDIQIILNEYNFENLYILAKEYAQFDESLREKPGKMPGQILRLSRDHAIQYDEALRIINRLNRDARSSASAGGGVSRSVSSESDSQGKPQKSLASLFGGGGKSKLFGNRVENSKAEKSDSSSSESDGSDSEGKPQKSLASLFGGGGESKAAEMRRKSMAAMQNPGASGATAATSGGTVTGDATAGAWTIERLQADAISQVDASDIDDVALTEVGYDGEGNEEQISQKEKARREVVKYIKVNKTSIESGRLSIAQFATQMEGYLPKKGIAYNSPIVQKALAGGYQRQATNSNAKKQTPGAGNKSAPTLSIAEQALAQKAEKAGISVEEYKKQQEEREAEAAKAYLEAITKAQKQGSEERASQGVLSPEEKKLLFEGQLPERDRLIAEINRIKNEKESAERSFAEKEKELEKTKTQLGGGRNTISEEEKDLIRNRMAENEKKIRDIEAESAGIEEIDRELLNIPAKIKEVDESSSGAGVKAKQRENLQRRKTELDNTARDRKTRKSKIKTDIQDLKRTIVRDQQQLDSGDRTEGLRTELTRLEGELAAINRKCAQLEQQIKALEAQKLQIFLDAGLTAEDIKVLEKQQEEQDMLKRAQADAAFMQGNMQHSPYFKAREKENDSEDGYGSGYESD